MIIDSEVHILPQNWDKLSAEEAFIRDALLNHSDYSMIKDQNIDIIVDSMNKNGVGKALLMGLPWLNNENNIVNNDIVLSIKDTNPENFDVMLIYNLKDINGFINYIEKIDKAIIKGIKFIGGWQDTDFTSIELKPVFEFMVKNKLVFMPHINHLIQDDSLDSPQKLFKLAVQFPDLKILATHMGGGLFLYEGYDKIRNLLKNVRYITSVSATMYMVQNAMSICPDKIIFGTDFPFNHCHNQSSQIGFIKQHINKQYQEKIFYRNYRDFMYE